MGSAEGQVYTTRRLRGHAIESGSCTKNDPLLLFETDQGMLCVGIIRTSGLLAVERLDQATNLEHHQARR
jgi:hypothetical protein